MNDKATAAIIGGIFIGATSAIPPINVLNACCCSLVICGGIIAARSLVKASPMRVSTADGAVVGLMAGAIGAAVATILKIPIDIMTRPFTVRYVEWLVEWLESTNAALPPDLREIMLEKATEPPGLAGIIGAFFIFLVLFCIFGPLGGMLGIAIFEKRPKFPVAQPTQTEPRA